MLLLHQTGSVNVGEIARYTVTYTPSLDRILPPPPHLHVRIKNTSAIPLRAAYLHGPYTLYVACYPSTFDPNSKYVTGKEEGEPDYEPQLKAGGSWSAKLTVPESIRQDAGLGEHKEGEPRKSFTWIVEVASQVLFSTTASVHFEVLVGRDEKSVTLGFTGAMTSSGAPGRLEDHQHARQKGAQQTKGVFTKAIKLKVDDTISLWSSPAFPSHDDTNRSPAQLPRIEHNDNQDHKEPSRKRRKKIHLVILTHGLHSNLGADMLYMKESIEVTAKQAREDRKNAKRSAREEKAKQQYDFGREAVDQRTKSVPDLVVAPTKSRDQPGNDEDDHAEDDDDMEEVVVKGFRGNAVKTERGIQFLGKRLAKYVLSITYPDQPYLPVKSTITQSISRTFTGAPKPTQTDGRHPTHKNSSIAKDEDSDKHDLPYKITSISFIGHSLGGLIQTYAIAYIQKHSPEFFDKIEPVSFVAMASPFLGLSNENPMYVKFALDFGLVGRTGQDLGLTWRAPTLARNGWGAMVGGFSSDPKDKEKDPAAKPLLRILPTGPAHVALKRFRNRSVYANVVNDGVVPLRTSCLLFLDWRGLGRVEKARRENGLIGTMVNWGLAEITGQNASTPRRGFFEDLFSDSGDERPRNKASPDPGSAVPYAEAGEALDNSYSYDGDNEDPKQSQLLHSNSPEQQPSGQNMWSTLTSFFRPHAGSQKERKTSPKQQRIFQRGQTMGTDQISDDSRQTSAEQERKEGHSSPDHRKMLVRGSSLYTNNSDNELDAPPKTTVFESAGDLLNPPLPPKEFLLDPEARPRTIFHDRVYHPEDIPPPPTKRQRTFMRSRPSSSDVNNVPNQDPNDMSKISSGPEQGGMRIEEKIARAYHKDMAWRKVLVRLEPDAHNNMIVRRMFANAYGWPVVKHMCDTHFAYTAAAETRDEDEAPIERAKAQDVKASQEGEEVRQQTQKPDRKDTLERQLPERANTAESLPEKGDHEVDTLHLRQKNIQAQDHAKPKPEPRSATSPTGESRDRMTELVSMVSAQGAPNQSYSSMHSGTAALNRLARQDSSKWSDRYFDSDPEDEDEDEAELNSEWQQAYDRGQRPLTESPRSTRSSKRTHGGSSLRTSALLGGPDAQGLVDEPEEIASRKSSLRSNPSFHEQVVSPDPQMLSLTGVGLMKSQQDIAKETQEADEPGSPRPSIMAQVTHARTPSGGESNAKRPDLGDPKKTLD